MRKRDWGERERERERGEREREREGGGGCRGMAGGWKQGTLGWDI